MSRFVRISFSIGIVLALLQFIYVISIGNVIIGLFWGIVPVWFWATYQKLKQKSLVRPLEGIAAYGVVLYGGVMALATILFLLATIGFWVLDPEVIQTAMEQQSSFDDLSNEELAAVNQLMEWLPSLMPILTLGICLQSISYIGYGLAVVRHYSR